LQAHLVIEDESGREKAERLLQKSEQACLISNSVKSRVTMKTNIQANAERPEIILA
jgi:organic hydroperoxide reductase OsmC/OhrA